MDGWLEEQLSHSNVPIALYPPIDNSIPYIYPMAIGVAISSCCLAITGGHENTVSSRWDDDDDDAIVGGG